MAEPRILVLGVGNTLMGDDGVGVYAVQALSERYDLPAHVRVVDGGVAGLRLLSEIATADYMIIVDAMKHGGEAGMIQRFHGNEIIPRRGPLVSAHEGGIAELLATAEFTGQLPPTDIIGVEPLSVDTVVLELSPPLSCALPQVIAAIVELLQARGVALNEKSQPTLSEPFHA